MRLATFNELRTMLAKQGRLVAASIDITRQCNQRCVHCLRDLSNDDGLTRAEVFSVLDQLADLGCLKVTFTGGEPFARPDFLDSVAYAWGRRLAIVILTNGTLLTPATCADLQRSHVSELQVSVYAADADIHDQITTVRGSHARTMRGIRVALEHNLSVRVATPILLANAGHVRAVGTLCAELGVRFTEGPLVFCKNDGDRRPLELLATEEQLRTHAIQSRRAMPVPAMAPQYAAEGEPLCSAGRDHLGIGTDGDIYPCDALRVPLGNVRQHRIADIWSASKPLLILRAERRRHLSECQGCGVRAYCMWCPGLSLQLVGDRTVPNFQDCRRTRVAYPRSEGDTPGWSVPDSVCAIQP